jgi:hypothetical protein
MDKSLASGTHVAHNEAGVHNVKRFLPCEIHLLRQICLLKEHVGRKYTGFVRCKHEKLFPCATGILTDLEAGIRPRPEPGRQGTALQLGSPW